MGAVFSFIANIMGYALNFIYNIVNNYGLAVIIFTVLLKLIMMPYNIKQQKTMKKSQKVQALVTEIQEKYSSDPVRANQEVMDLYKREGVNPMSGCLSSLVTLFIFISIFYLVSRPLTYMRHIDSSKIEEYTKIINEQNIVEQKEESKEDVNTVIVQNVTEAVEVSETKENQEEKSVEVKEKVEEDNNKENSDNDQQTENKEENKRARNYVEIAIIKEFGEKDEEVNLNMNFLGLNLSDIPSENLSNPKVFIIPVLYVITSLIMMKLTKNMTQQAQKEAHKEVAPNSEELALEKKEKDEQQAAMEEMSKSMTLMMPIMSVMISMIAPLGLALYWFTSNLFSIGERLITNKIMKKAGEE